MHLTTSLYRILLVSVTFFLAPLSACAQSTSFDYPPAKRVDHTDNYHGVTVSDPYRWMEKLDDEALMEWLEKEDALRATYLDDSDAVAHFKRRIEATRDYASETIPRFQGDHAFFYKRAAGQTFGELHVRAVENESKRLLLDIEAMNNDAQSAGVTSYSRDGEYLTLGVAEGQSRWFDVQVVRTDNGERLPETLTGFYSGRSGIAWTHDNAGFFYARYDVPEDPLAPLGRPQVVYHKAGTRQGSDRVVFEMPDAPQLAFSPRVTHDGRYLVLSASEGGGTFNGLYERLFYKDLHRESSPVTELFSGVDALFAFESNDGETFRIRTTHEALNNRIVELNVQHPKPEHWTELIPEASESIQAVSEIGDALVVQYIKDARIVVRVFGMNGKERFELDLLSPSMTGFNDNRESGVTHFSASTLFDPGTIHSLDVSSGESDVYFRPQLNHNPGDFVQEQVFFESKDGTRVPMFILHKKGLKRDGSNPVFMYAYGAWSWSAFPWQAHMIPWMEAGGVYAIANIRGGGEYGEAWHEAGIRKKKQNGIDDFLAAAEWLIDNDYTTPSKLIANGGSASGVIAGAATIQRPDLFAVSVINFPALDQLRYEQFGSAKGWVSEFGTVEDAGDFAALRAYSPYHNVQEGVCYPAAWIQVGEEDETTTPMHGYKYAAALQHAQSCDKPVLLKVTWGAGHSYGATPEQRAETQAEELAFMAKVVGVDIR